MTHTNQEFIFDSYSWSEDGRTLSFSYILGEHPFTEILELSSSITTLEEPVRHSVLFALHIALGMSYWKTSCPKTLIVRSGILSKDQADFWNTVYTKGLGEFFYHNEIDYRGLVQFPFSESAEVAPPVALETEGILLPLGGGKDSALSLGLISKHKDLQELPLNTFSVNSYKIIAEQVKLFETDHLTITRRIDKTLLELNEQGAYNGHVPISVIYGLSAVLQAALTGRQYVVLSNERSANIGNVEYLGEEINHQWSKSLEYENMFQEYVHSYITPDITYFSFLRPLSELHIAKLFNHFVSDWLPHITSCNRNFRIAGDATQRWCGECAKCVFVYIMFAPFIWPEQLIAAFNKNMFADESLLPLVEALVGKTEAKPFDCVGTVEEVTYALLQENVRNAEEYKNTPLIKYIETEIVPAYTTAQINALQKEAFAYKKTETMPREFSAALSQAVGLVDRLTTYQGIVDYN